MTTPEQPRFIPYPTERRILRPNDELSLRGTTRSLFFDLSDPKLKTKLALLRPTPGYCVLIDMVWSTALKDRSTHEWLSRIHDTLKLSETYLSEFPRLKIIGDCAMYYVPEFVIESHGGGALSKLFLELCYVVQEEDEAAFGKTKAAVAYCSDAYEVTFQKGTEDIYGKDIDLTARLASTACKGEIIMNEPFVERLHADSKVSSISPADSDVSKITGPQRTRFKGFEEDVNVYKLPIGGTALSRQNYPRYFT